LAAVRLAGDESVFRTYATWNGWAFDHSGWNPESELLAVNEEFDGHPLERIHVALGLAEFCEQHNHRMPNQYWRDPLPRAHEYVGRYAPPWA